MTPGRPPRSTLDACLRDRVQAVVFAGETSVVRARGG
jgi:hypothetical protein